MTDKAKEVIEAPTITMMTMVTISSTNVKPPLDCLFFPFNNISDIPFLIVLPLNN